jgi:hypothetical protein
VNNRERQRKARNERMDPQLYVRVPNATGRPSIVPLGYLAPRERAAFLAKAVTPL